MLERIRMTRRVTNGGVVFNEGQEYEAQITHNGTYAQAIHPSGTCRRIPLYFDCIIIKKENKIIMGTSHKKLNSATEALRLSKENKTKEIEKDKILLTQKLVDAVDWSISRGCTGTSGLLKNDINTLIQFGNFTEVGEHIKKFFEKEGYKIKITSDGVSIDWD